MSGFTVIDVATVGQRIADGIVGDGATVIRGQTVLPAIGGVAVGMGALKDISSNLCL